MLKVILGIFIILHGLVHLFYFGQSRRLVELRPGMTWPDDSWIFLKIVAKKTTRLIAGILCLIVTLIFVAGGFAFFLKLDWWRYDVLAGTVMSSVIYIIFWDGRLKKLDDNGGIGILINIAILTVVLTVSL